MHPGREALDEMFKTVIHDSDVLAWLLKGNVDEFMDRTIEEIKGCLTLGEDRRTVIGCETEFVSERNGKVILDSVFDVRVPDSDDKVSVIVNVEGQGNPNPEYPLGKRAEYYVARMVSDQKGKYFKGSDYGSIRKTYSIWCVLNPKTAGHSTATRYRMMGENTFGPDGRWIEPLETFNIIMINIGQYEDGLPDGVAFPAAVFSRMRDENRRRIVSDRFNIALEDDTIGRLRDMTTLDQEVYEYGFSMGKAEGEAIGEARGKAIGEANATKKFLALVTQHILLEAERTGESPEQVLSRYPIYAEYSKEIVEEIRKHRG